MNEIVFIDIDTQCDFMKPRGALYVNGAEDLIPRLRLITQIAEREGIFIISSVDRHIKYDLEFKQFPPHCLIATPGQKKIPQTLLKRHVFIPKKILSRQELFRKLKGYQQVIIEKATYDIFSNFNLLRILRAFRVAFVYGVALDYCVKHAVLGLLQLGLRVNLVIDATKPIDAKYSRDLTDYFKKCGVNFVYANNLVSELLRFA